jgi:hypothetical protein
VATFGNTSTTNDTYWYDLDYKVASKYTLSEAGLVSKLSVYAKKVTGTGVARLFIQDDDGSGGGPGTLLATTPEISVSSSTLSWIDGTFASEVELAAGSYWLGIHFGGGLQVVGQESTTPGKYGTDTYSDGTSATWSGMDTYNVSWCIYATYSTTPSGIPMPLLCHYLLGD